MNFKLRNNHKENFIQGLLLFSLISLFWKIIVQKGANIDFGEKWRKLAKSGEIEIDYEIR